MTHDAAVGRSTRPEPPAAPPAVSRRRRVAHRVLAVLLTLWVLAMGIFGLTEVVAMWLPSDVLVRAFGGDGAPYLDPAYFDEHRSQFFQIGLIAWAMLLFSAAQVRRPARQQASMVVLVAMAAASLVAFGLTGSLLSWIVEEWLWALAVVGLVLLHPVRARLLTRAGHDRLMLLLAVPAAAAWLGYAVVNASRQLTRTGDAAVEELWGVSAVAAVAVAAAALAGAGDRPGWRLPAWYAVLASLAVGVHSLVFPGTASGLWPLTAVAAVVWGVAYGVAIRNRRRAAAA